MAAKFHILFYDEQLNRLLPKSLQFTCKVGTMRLQCFNFCYTALAHEKIPRIEIQLQIKVMS